MMLMKSLLPYAPLLGLGGSASFAMEEMRARQVKTKMKLKRLHPCVLLRGRRGSPGFARERLYSQVAMLTKMRNHVVALPPANAPVSSQIPTLPMAEQPLPSPLLARHPASGKP